jgi:hypothetical protein
MTSKKDEDHSNVTREVEFDGAWEITKALLRENDEEIANDLARWKARGYDIGETHCPTCGKPL